MSTSRNKKAFSTIIHESAIWICTCNEDYVNLQLHPELSSIPIRIKDRIKVWVHHILPSTNHKLYGLETVDSRHIICVLVSLQCIELGIEAMIQLFAIEVREVIPLPEISDLCISDWFKFSIWVFRILVEFWDNPLRRLLALSRVWSLLYFPQTRWWQCQTC